MEAEAGQVVEGAGRAEQGQAGRVGVVEAAEEEP